MTADASTTSSLVQRLVDERLTAPGMLDRRTLQRAHERFAQPTSMHGLNRLHRRIVPAASGTESLPLVRIDRMAEPEAMSPESTADAPVALAAEPASDRAMAPRADLAAGTSFGAPVSATMATGGADRATTERGSTRSFVGELVTPTARTGNGGELVARSTPGADRHGGLGTLSRKVDGASESATAGRPTIATSVVASGIVQRMAKPSAIVQTTGASTAVTAGMVPPAPAPVVPMATHGPPSLPVARVVMRKSDALARVPGIATAGALRRAPLGGIMRAPAPRTVNAPPSSGTLLSPESSLQYGVPSSSGMSLPSGTAPPLGTLLSAGAPPPSGDSLLARTSNAAVRVPASASPPPVAASLGAVASSGQLLLRKPDVAMMPAQPPTQTSSVIEPVMDAAMPTVAAPAAPLASSPGAQVWTSVGNLNMDWIAEQVGDRLARRLEIERERLGVRQWRQVS